LGFFVVLIGGAAALYGGLAWLTKACVYEPTSVSEATQSAQPEGGDKTKERHSQWQQESWYGKFMCDVKASDAAIAFFTFSLFVVGWFTMLGNEKMARDSQRAYVSGGGPWIRGAPLFPHPVGFQLTVDNYGKSPATVVEFALEVCEMNSLPEKPRYLRKDYTDRLPFRATVRPKQRALELANKRFPPMHNPVAYGRIWYFDIWRRPHYYSFVLPSDPRDHGRLSVLHRAYTDWT
jgi:hypothetical protein